MTGTGSLDSTAWLFGGVAVSGAGAGLGEEGSSAVAGVGAASALGGSVAGLAEAAALLIGVLIAGDSVVADADGFAFAGEHEARRQRIRVWGRG